MNVSICLFSKMCFIFNESSVWNYIHLFMFGNISLHWYAWNIKKKNIFFQTVFSGENVLSIEKQLPEEVSHKSRNLAITLGWCHPCYNTQSMLCVANTFASKSYNRNFNTVRSLQYSSLYMNSCLIHTKDCQICKINTK